MKGPDTYCVSCGMGVFEEDVNARGLCEVCAVNGKDTSKASAAVPHGGKHYESKLNRAAVRFIRACAEFGDATQSELASHFDVDRKTVWQVVKGRSWKHVSQDYRLRCPCGMVVREEEACHGGLCLLCYREKHGDGGGNRTSGTRGSDNGNAKLNPELVRFMRAAYNHGDFERYQDISEALGIPMTTVAKAITKTTWRHVRDDVEPYDVRRAA